MRIVAVVAALAFSAHANAACSQPTDWAQAFYAKHYRFYVADSNIDPNLLTPEFAALLKKEWAFSKGEVGHLDYDPWLGAQDGEIGKPVRFSKESGDPDIAVVAMSYLFALEPGRPTPPHAVHLVLRKKSNECWRLHDLITPLGESLSHVYSKQP
jgi:hypothetical protein